MRVIFLFRHKNYIVVHQVVVDEAANSGPAVFALDQDDESSVDERVRNMDSMDFFPSVHLKWGHQFIYRLKTT